MADLVTYIEGGKIKEAQELLDKMQSIDLSGKGIGAEGMKSLANALEKNTTIHSIYLGYNSIGAEGMKSLAEAIKSQLGINFKYIIFAYIFLSMLS